MKESTEQISLMTSVLFLLRIVEKKLSYMAEDLFNYLNGGLI